MSDDEAQTGLRSLAFTPQVVYSPTFSWGKGYVISESDVLGDWLDTPITSEMITAAFNPSSSHT